MTFGGWSGVRRQKSPRWSAERRAGLRHWPVIPGDPGIGPNRKAGHGYGDPYACFQRYWPHVPEEAKVRYRAMIRAAQAGLGAREIAAAARAAVAGWGAQAGKQQEKPLSRK